MSVSFLIKYRIILLFLIIPIFTTAQQKNNEKIDKICGRWATYSSLYTFFETWKKVNDSVFEGNSIIIFKGDTLFNDQMNLYKNEKKWILKTCSLLDKTLPEKTYLLLKCRKKKLIFQSIDQQITEQITYSFVEPKVMVINISTKDKSVNSYRMRKVS
jgi:hypothetical protein